MIFNLAWFRPRRKPDSDAAKAKAVALENLLACWTQAAMRGGPGSDVAAAKVYGAKAAILYLGDNAPKSTAKGWRGQAVNRG